MQNEKRLIDANALPMHKVKIVHSFGIVEGSVVFPDDIKKAPTIDAVPVVHGRWNWEGQYKACSECGTYINWDNTLGAGHWHYCPNCGAKMDGGAANGSDA